MMKTAFKLTQVIPNAQKLKPVTMMTQISKNFTTTYKSSSARSIEDHITQNLNHGQVQMWSLGDQCRKTKTTREMLRSNFIDFEEQDITKYSPKE